MERARGVDAKDQRFNRWGSRLLGIVQLRGNTAGGLLVAGLEGVSWREDDQHGRCRATHKKTINTIYLEGGTN